MKYWASTFMVALISISGFSQRGTISVASFTQSLCEQDKDEPKAPKNRIIRKFSQDGILTIEIGAWAHCCVIFEGAAMVQDKKLYLDIIDSHKSAPCECFCFYRFVYELSEIKPDPTEVFLKDKAIELTDEPFNIYPVTFKILNSDTVNLTDRYGQKQGKWASIYDSTMSRGYVEYLDNHILKKITLYPGKKIQSATLFGKEYTEYYESGSKKQECDLSKIINNCKEWDEKGILVYEGTRRK